MINFRNSFQQKEFSCMMPDVEFSCSFTRALVSVTLSKSGDSEKIYEEYLFPDDNGLITLADIDLLIEPYAEKWLVFDLSVNVVEQLVSENADGGEVITASNSDTMSTTVVSCKANILNVTATDWCSGHFLTLIQGTRQTAIGWREFLCFIGNDTASCMAVYDDGTSVSHSVSVMASGDYQLLDVSPANFTMSGKELVCFNIYAGQRSQSYEVVPDFDVDIAPVLIFWNSFGVQELAYCTGEHQQVSSFDRKQTRIGRKKQSYSIEEKETFKADTGVLSYPMANWWREVFRSKDIRLLPFQNGGVLLEEGIPIVITSEKAELSNAADHLPRFTFEYEYADRNHNVWDSRRDGRIFDNTFDYTFN